MKKVVIIGASFAGLSCAKELADKDFEVTILEKNSQVGIKTCAAGVTKQDLEFIPELQMNFPLEPVYLISDGEKVQMPWGRGMISSIVRPEILKGWQSELKSFSNINILLNTKAVDYDDVQVKTEDGQAYDYDYLVGADGAFSLVRKNDGMATEDFMAAVQYLIPNTDYKGFQIFEDEELFDKGYAWIFPNRYFTSIGAAVDSHSPNLKSLHKNLDAWIAKSKIDITDGKYEGFIINYDYSGWNLQGKIFLAGDAGGFSNGLTGKGIYAACISGKTIAQTIIGGDVDYSKLDAWMREKYEDEQELRAKGNFVIRKISKLKALISKD